MLASLCYLPPSGVTGAGVRTQDDPLAASLLAYRPVVAWLARGLTALAQPEIGDRLATLAAHVQRLLAGDDASLAGQVRVAASVGALMGPLVAVVALDTQPLSALRGTLAAAALAPLSAE